MNIFSTAFTCFFLVLFFHPKGFCQEGASVPVDDKLAYFSPSFGFLIVHDPSFADTYKSRVVAKGGLELAVPITRFLFLKGGFGYLRKRGVPTINTYDPDTGTTTSRKEGKAVINAKVFQVGGEVNFETNSSISIQAEIAGLLVLGTEKLFDSDDAQTSSSEYGGLLLPVVGLGVTYKFQNLGVFLNPRYTKPSSSQKTLLYSGPDLGGLSIQSGVRLYF